MTLTPTATRLLNLGHALDHMALLIFATAVTSIAPEFGFSRWEDLMPYGAGAFFMFGLGSLPAGRLGDGGTRRRQIGARCAERRRSNHAATATCQARMGQKDSASGKLAVGARLRAGRSTRPTKRGHGLPDAPWGGQAARRAKTG